ncbi:hypothetical protein TYRP_022730 [Tyrophagus putrescentiae]|nr:hypothetical protein TYRP_022730 [Tyrophagus putrescentiae]
MATRFSGSARRVMSCTEKGVDGLLRLGYASFSGEEDLLNLDDQLKQLHPRVVIVVEITFCCDVLRVETERKVEPVQLIETDQSEAGHDEEVKVHRGRRLHEKGGVKVQQPVEVTQPGAAHKELGRSTTLSCIVQSAFPEDQATGDNCTENQKSKNGANENLPPGHFEAGRPVSSLQRAPSPSLNRCRHSSWRQWAGSQSTVDSSHKDVAKGALAPPAQPVAGGVAEGNAIIVEIALRSDEHLRAVSKLISEKLLNGAQQLVGCKIVRIQPHTVAERQDDHRLAGGKDLRDGVVSPVGDHQVHLGEDVQLGEETITPLISPRKFVLLRQRALRDDVLVGGGGQGGDQLSH